MSTLRDDDTLASDESVTETPTTKQTTRGTGVIDGSQISKRCECQSASDAVENSLGESTVDLQLRKLHEALKNILSIIDSLEKLAGTGRRVRANLKDEVNGFEAAIIRAALLQTDGNRAQAARLLSVKPNTLRSKVSRLGLSELVQEL